MIAQRIVCENAEPYTTDIMNEPITADGLKLKLERLGSENLEVLCESVYAEQIANIAHSINMNDAITVGNVIDVKSRKAVSRETLSYNIVIDNSPGRNSTGYVIFEAVGAPRLIAKLTQELEKLFSDRRVNQAKR